MRTQNLLTLAFCLVGAGQATFAADKLSLAELTNFCFQSISVHGTQMVFQCSGSGQRFYYSVDQGPEKLSHYQEKITVPIGGTFHLVHRHGTISFSPLPESVRSCGFAVCASDDLRSVGGEIVRREAYLIAVPKRGVGKNSIPESGLRCVEPTVTAVQAALAGGSTPGITITNVPPGRNN